MSVDDDEILNPNIPDLPSKKEVIKLCRKNGLETNHLTHSHNDWKFFIKYNGVKMGEARNQHYFYEQITKRSDITIHISEVYHAFTSEYKTYIVMEHIDINHFASDEQRANAITELLRIEPPSDATPGPIGGGRVKHRFFRDFTSGVVYPSVSELERHVLRLFKRPGEKEPKTVDFINEKMICYYSDIYKENFPVSSDGQVWVVDFDQAGVLPISFMSFALDVSYRHPLPPTYRRLVPIERTKNLIPMYRASCALQMSGEKCGLEEDET